MNLLELNNQLSSLLADSSTNFFTQSERLQALNNACNYLNSEVRILRTVAYITVTPLDESIPLPDNFVSLGKGIQWSDGKLTTSLERKVPIQLQSTNSDWETQIGTPTYYVLEGSQIYLNPKPAQPGTLILSYLATPNKLIDDDDVPFYGDPRIQAYHDIIAFYAAWQLTLKDRDFEAAQMFMQWFQTRKVDLVENLRHTGDVSVQPVWSDTYSTT